MNIELSKEVLADIYADCNTAGRQAIKNELGDQLSEILPVTTRVKTLDDAIAELGEDHEAVKAYRDIEWKLGNAHKDLLAYLKLRIITIALNGGWMPRFVEGELRWYGWYELISKDDLEAVSEEERKDGRMVVRANSNANAYGGLVYSDTSNTSLYSNAHYGSRLTFKTKQLAEYAAKQFIDIYADFCFIPATKENK